MVWLKEIVGGSFINDVESSAHSYVVSKLAKEYYRIDPELTSKISIASSAEEDII
jgi:hypothetical protein